MAGKHRMSLQSQYNITDKTMAKYSPLDQLSSRYLNEVLKKGQVVVFNAGETLFEKNHELHSYYYLLKGKLVVKKGMLFSKTISSKSEQALHPINSFIPNNTSVKAQTDGHLLLIDPGLLDRALAWSNSNAQSEQTQEREQPQTQESLTTQPNESSDEPKKEFDSDYFNWMTSLLEFPLFLNLPPANIDKLFEKFERIEVLKDQTIIKEDDEGDYFYLLINGSAKVVVGADNSKLATLRPGAYFGEEALVSDIVRSASVIMEEDGRLARLDKESFQNLLHDPLVKYVNRKDAPSDMEQGNALLDIRSKSEFEFIPLPNCLHIPLNDLRTSLDLLDKSVTYYLTEGGGQRSEIAAHILSQNQFKVFVLQ
jgi:CRP-like cAMP-binding protein/rhodanese-related sulfurtransferase